MVFESISKISIQSDDRLNGNRVVDKVDEKQERFLKAYLILVIFTVLNYGYQYVLFNSAFWDCFLDSLFFFFTGNLIIIWLYRKTDDTFDNTTH